ncbi:MAG: adenosine deaminase [Acidobacteria bacterium]|nr:adenosine deaminase [Acidobacteriota bacterium]
MARVSYAKAELHVHLEGSMEPELLCRLDSSLTIEEARRLYQFNSFAGFIEAFKAAVRRLQRPDDYALAANELFQRMAAESTQYAEVIFSAGVVVWKQQSLDDVWAALRTASEHAPLRVRWIVDVVRQFGSEPAGMVAAWAARHAGEGIVAFGVGGDETARPLREFARPVAIAAEAGLHFVPHAGETSNAQDVWDAVEMGAARIGHGIRAVEDRSLLALLRERNIPLEVCPVSNVRTGAVERMESHPLRRLFDAGVPVTLNSDDPGLFQTTLAREFESARDVLGFTERELREIAANAERYAFGFQRAK